MHPSQLNPASFAAYPPQARALAIEHLPLLRDLPIVLLPILLRELITYDWRFPAERRELTNQLTWLTSLSVPQRTSALAAFRALSLEPALTNRNWVENPNGFMEDLTAWLWSTHRMDSFRATADTYTSTINTALPSSGPATPRLGIVILGAGAATASTPLFRKLKPHGIHLTRVVAKDGVSTLIAEAVRRAALTSTPFSHWYIDGGSAPATPALTQVSYAHLEQPRTNLLNRIQQSIATGAMGPEELRSLLTRIKPAEIGLTGPPAQATLDHFQLSLLTEGAGAQIFATTFVQWAARECIRRAQPETLLVRYAPRQQVQTMNAMLSGAPVTGTDPAGSLTDADMGAYYTWLNLRRLPGSDQLRFLVWFEDHSEAIAIGPGLPQGATSDSLITMPQVVSLFA